MKTITRRLHGQLCVALVVLFARLSVPAVAWGQYQVLHNFQTATEGAYPAAGLTWDGSKLYGATEIGGSSSNGTVFSINTDGSGFALLHTFAGAPADGRLGSGELTIDGAQIHGIGRFGGATNDGVIFSMNTDGTGYVLRHSFGDTATDGRWPLKGLTLDGTKLYGATDGGGGGDDLGTIFSINTDGSGYATLRSFAGGADDGSQPYGAVTVVGTTLYGMTSAGGGNDMGTLFSMNADGADFTILHHFAGGAADGRIPWDELTLIGSTFYGVTNYGGTNNGGTVFSIDIDGTDFKVLHSFVGGSGDGRVPNAKVTLLGGKLYSTTLVGGDNSVGTVFSMNLDGTGFQLLHEFGGTGDGRYPYSRLTAVGSTLFGTTSGPGSGTIFAITVPEPSTFLLAALALLSVLWIAARRRSALRPRTLHGWLFFFSAGIGCV